MRYGSLCTGIGGLDLAVEAHYGAEPAWVAEYEPHLDPILQRHFGPILNLKDLTTVDWADLEPVDVLTAGYPCQPFSHAGLRKGSSDVRHLWPHIAHAVRVLRPRYVVLENVAGHLSLGFDTVLADLADAGFDAEWCLLRASDVGAPHRRARIFVVATDTDDAGFREQRGAFSAPPKHPSVECRTVADAGGVGRGSGTGLRESEPGGLGRGRPRNDDGEAPTDPAGTERRGPQHDALAAAVGSATEPRERVGEVAWGQYEPAIRRWEHVLGRPAPAPTDTDGRLSPAFVEWMQGYPPGWVAGLTRTQALKALGNAVVPQQGLAALRELAPVMEAVA